MQQLVDVSSERLFRIPRDVEALRKVHLRSNFNGTTDWKGGRGDFHAAAAAAD